MTRRRWLADAYAAGSLVLWLVYPAVGLAWALRSPLLDAVSQSPVVWVVAMIAGAVSYGMWVWMIVDCIVQIARRRARPSTGWLAAMILVAPTAWAYYLFRCRPRLHLPAAADAGATAEAAVIPASVPVSGDRRWRRRAQDLFVAVCCLAMLGVQARGLYMKLHPESWAFPVNSQAAQAQWRTLGLQLGVTVPLMLLLWGWMLADCITELVRTRRKRLIAWLVVVLLLQALGAVVYYFAEARRRRRSDAPG